MLVLGIETSCDETSVALVEDGRRVLASDVASQIALHAQFGGVVPELASRAHIQRLIPMVHGCLQAHGLKLADIDAIATTVGPGLVGALLVGVETAKALAFAASKPFIPVHHVEGHLYSPFLLSDDPAHQLLVIQAGAESASSTELEFPYVGLAVSGGHTSLVIVHSATHFELAGETLDDAAGEAFDKLAKLLSLGYPGGPLVQKAAEGGDARKYDLPRPLLGRGNKSFDFSFSGLKTAVQKLVKELGGPEAVTSNSAMVSDVCACFQEAVVDVLLKKCSMLLEARGIGHLAIVGGVACNGRLRAAAQTSLPAGTRAFFPAPAFCTDNAAMIAGLAFHHRNSFRDCDLTVNALASLSLGSYSHPHI